VNKILLVFALLIASANADARFGNDAMFGLKWGMSRAEVQKLGVSLESKEEGNGIATYRTASLPKNLSDIDFYILFFANDRLVKISAVGDTIENDPSGREGKERYEALKASLTDKYGSGKSSEITGVSLYKDYDEFYQCLNYSGCGMWATIFNTEDRVMLVEIEGVGRGTGYITIKAESVPEFSAALNDKRQAESESDKDAL
jgi:hypothetical protein